MTHSDPPRVADLGFYTAIPLVTNPWIWLDMGKALAVPWVGLSLLMLWTLRDEPWSEIWPAWRVVTLCVLGVAALLVLVAIVVFGNHVDARFTLDGKGVLYESTSSTRMAWAEVRKVTRFPRAHVVTLSNAWRPVLRVYCGDASTYARVIEIVDAHTGGPVR